MIDINHVVADSIFNKLKFVFITECVHKACATAMYRYTAIAKIVKNEINTNIHDNVSKIVTECLEEILRRNIHKNEIIDVHRSATAKLRTKAEQLLGIRTPRSRKPFKRTPSDEIIIRHIFCASSDFTLNCTSWSVPFFRLLHISQTSNYNYGEECGQFSNG